MAGEATGHVEDEVGQADVVVVHVLGQAVQVEAGQTVLALAGGDDDEVSPGLPGPQQLVHCGPDAAPHTADPGAGQLVGRVGHRVGQPQSGGGVSRQPSQAVSHVGPAAVGDDANLASLGYFVTGKEYLIVVKSCGLMKVTVGD